MKNNFAFWDVDTLNRLLRTVLLAELKALGLLRWVATSRASLLPLCRLWHRFEHVRGCKNGKMPTSATASIGQLCECRGGGGGRALR